MTMSRGRTMTTKHASRWRPLLAVAAVAALVPGMPPDASAKKKPAKNVLTATINGKTIKFRRNVSIQAGGTTVALFVIGQTRPHGILRTLGVGCGDFPPATVPGSSNFCTFSYQEAKLGRHPTIKAWELPLATGRVDFSAYDGSVVSGTFSSVLTSLSGEPPVTVEGQFSGHIAASN